MAYIKLMVSERDSSTFTDYANNIDLLYGTTGYNASGSSVRSASPIPIPDAGTNKSWFKLLTFKRDTGHSGDTITELKMWCDKPNSSNSTGIKLYASVHTGSTLDAPRGPIGIAALAEGSTIGSLVQKDFYANSSDSGWANSYVFCTGGVAAPGYPDYDWSTVSNAVKTVGVFQLFVGTDAVAGGGTWALAMTYQFKVT
jgi:hypothetical protein